ncbi:MAG: hydrogenase small subunit [Candidatus Afipia apatlaquensis]|uniref:hydrogenase (acceptor) n=1 Tax=Candidatus Afipia apatlaquensis TaxID=2712852 RepID=A0A7C9VGN5_9BRAD|nr:hydrogenase small subunit [Candidatus Afipia apatlaquensis]
MKLIWLETDGCSGNIISYLDAHEPNAGQVLFDMVDLVYSNSLMASCGEYAMEKLFDTLDKEFILIVEGAIPVRDGGIYTIIGRYRGRPYTALETVKLLGGFAKYIISLGTCASYAGISAAAPNPTDCKSVKDVIGHETVKLPLCPINPGILSGVLYSLIKFGVPPLDNENRPLETYGITIHDRCPRRSYFDKGIFAKKPGEITCMFKLGCSGPKTRTDCPIRRWNSTEMWPIGASTPCIGCANRGFPDGTEPFIKCSIEDGGAKE